MAPRVTLDAPTDRSARTTQRVTRSSPKNAEDSNTIKHELSDIRAKLDALDDLDRERMQNEQDARFFKDTTVQLAGTMQVFVEEASLVERELDLQTAKDFIRNWSTYFRECIQAHGPPAAIGGTDNG